MLYSKQQVSLCFANLTCIFLKSNFDALIIAIEYRSHFLGRTSYRRPFRRRYGAHFLRLFTIHIRTHHLGWAGSAIIPFTVPHYARCNSVCGELMLLICRASVASLRVTCCQASSSLSLLCQFKIILFGSTFGPVPACSSL